VEGMGGSGRDQFCELFQNFRVGIEETSFEHYYSTNALQT